MKRASSPAVPPGPVLSVSKRLLRVALAASGFVIALSATMESGAGSRAGRGARLVLRLPDPLVAAILACCALAVLFLLAVLFPRGLRRRPKKDEEDPEPYYEPRKLSPGIVVLLSLLVLSQITLVCPT